MVGVWLNGRSPELGTKGLPVEAELMHDLVAHDPAG